VTVHVGQNFEWTSANKPGEEFQFLEKLGEGSYGTAYKAVHGSQSFVVAIKVTEVILKSSQVTMLNSFYHTDWDRS